MDKVLLYQLFHVIIVLFLEFSSLVMSLSNDRKTDKFFGNSTTLYGMSVTCDTNVKSEAVFPADTWSCHDMRIDGMRLRYWYIPDVGPGGERHCSNKADGLNYDGQNDIGALCRELLKAHGVHRDLWTVYVTDTSCERSQENRVIFMYNYTVDSFSWKEFPQGRGYMKTFRCMTQE